MIESFNVANANIKVVKPAIDPDCAMIGFLSNLDKRTFLDILFVAFIAREAMRIWRSGQNIANMAKTI